MCILRVQFDDELKKKKIAEDVQPEQIAPENTGSEHENQPREESGRFSIKPDDVPKL